jgi:hypothetical protein
MTNLKLWWQICLRRQRNEEISLLKGQLDELYAHVNMEVSYIILTVEPALMILLYRMIMGHAWLSMQSSWQ